MKNASSDNQAGVCRDPGEEKQLQEIQAWLTAWRENPEHPADALKCDAREGHTGGYDPEPPYLCVAGQLCCRDGDQLYPQVKVDVLPRVRKR